ncbi:MAG: 50S ribosomal protein L33 [Planctomycetota bacterium]
MRQYVTLECTECKSQNYRTSTETRGGGRLELKKFCRFCRKHTPHRQKKR